MLILAAALLFLVGLMHSVLGGRRLITPLLERPDLPIILNSIANTRLTLWVGWHLLTLFFWGNAVLLIVIAIDPARAVTAALMVISSCTGLAGSLAVTLTRGKHKSWIMFIPVSVLTGLSAFGPF
jgi:hypothetical protein